MRGFVFLALLAGCTRENPEALDRVVAPPPPPGALVGRDLGRADFAVGPVADLAAPLRDLATPPDLRQPFAAGVTCGGTLCTSSSCCTSDGGKTGFCVTDAAQCP